MTFFPRTPKQEFKIHHFGVHKFLRFPPIGKPFKRTFVTLENTFVTLYQVFQLKLIWPFYWTIKWFEVILAIWLLTFQMGITCVWGPFKKKCDPTLIFYSWRYFQWFKRGLIWTRFSPPNFDPNIKDISNSATPKMGVHLGVLRLDSLVLPHL